MKTKANLLITTLFALFLFFACKENKPTSDLETLRNSNNRTSYPVAKMDSAQAIQFITKQKIQELFDLSTLYTAGNRDTEIDSVIYQQIQGYFAKPDSSKIKPLLLQLDSLKVKTAKVGNISVSKAVKEKDTIDLAKFNVEYFGANNKSIGNFEKTAQYTLKLSPVKFKKEFKFYFVDFDIKAQKDSTLVGKTK